MTPLNSFHLFNSLPTELRLKVFRHMEQICTTPHTTTSSSSPPPPPRTTRANIANLHIVKISFSPSDDCYVSNTAPPVTLAICKESREQTLLSWSHLSLGPAPNRKRLPANEKTRSRLTTDRRFQSYALSPNLNSFTSLYSPSSTTSSGTVTATPATDKLLPIPINYAKTILYISSLSLLLSTMQFQHTFLFHLSTSPGRHLLQWLAIDLRVWNELCEHGFLGVLGRMQGLRGLRLVVEFVSLLYNCRSSTNGSKLSTRRHGFRVLRSQGHISKAGSQTRLSSNSCDLTRPSRFFRGYHNVVQICIS